MAPGRCACHIGKAGEAGDKLAAGMTGSKTALGANAPKRSRFGAGTRLQAPANEVIAVWHAMCSKGSDMHRSRLPVVAVAFALAASVGLVSGKSFATVTVALTEASITRQTALRDQSQNPLWISRADCLADDVMTFPLYVSGSFGGYGLEVWVGGSSNDCKTTEARNTTTGTCWKVYEGSASTNSISIPIKVRDIVAQNKPVDDGGPGSGTLEDCSPALSTTAAVQIAIYFMFIDPSDQSNQGGVLYKMAYDLLGPNAPGTVTVGQGDTMLKINWTQSTDTDLVGYQFFCEKAGATSNVQPFDAANGDVENEDGSIDSPPAPPPAPADDASDEDSGVEDVAEASTPADTSGVDATSDTGVSDAETDGDAEASTTHIEGTCNSKGYALLLYQGDNPDPALKCGQVTGLTTTTGRVTGLVNGDIYSIAIAGYDAVGNVGKLSNVVCEEPWPVDDFYKLYREAGGQGGGGFCSVGSVGQSAGMAGLGLMGMAAIAGLVRRRRKGS
jgi:MYXO-CTERM domain-containing protein